MSVKKIISVVLTLFLILLSSSCAKSGNKSAPVQKDESAPANPVSEIQQAKSESETAPENSSAFESETMPEDNSASETETSLKEEKTSQKEETSYHTHKWEIKKVAATCTEKGYTLKSCACGESSKSNFSNALGHNWGKWKTVKAATADADGAKERTCSRCNKKETAVIPKVPMTANQKQTEVWKLVNQERGKNGLPPLTYKSDLQALADKRAEEISKSFSHTRPDGKNCFSVFDDYGFGNSFYRLGENIAYGYQTPADVMNGWMNSSGHRENILGNYTGIVVGVYGNYWVQLFVCE